MFSKFAKIILFILLLSAFVAFFFWNPVNDEIISVSEIKNMETGELVAVGDTFREGEVLERRVLVKNPTNETLKDYLFKDKNPLTQKTQEYKIDLAPGEQKVFTEEIAVDKIANLNLLEKEEQGEEWKILGSNTEQLNNNFDALFELFGENLLMLEKLVFDCETQKFVLPFTSKNKDKVTLVIPAFALTDGQCKLKVLVNGLEYNLNKSITVVQDQDSQAGMNLKSIVPNRGFTDQDNLFILTGKGFDKIVAIQIDNGVVLDVKFVEKISDTTMVVNIPKGLKTGEYFFRFLGKDSVQSYPNITFILENNEKTN